MDFSNGLETKAKDAVPFPRYVCPRTHEALVFEAGALRAPSGTSCYDVQGGIPRFLASSGGLNGQDSGHLKRLNDLAPHMGWRQALIEVYGADPIVEYTTDSTRAAFIDLLPISNKSDVLEIGPGLGQFTVYLAQRARSVSCLELVPQQAAFVAQRCHQESAANVQIAVGGDDCRLPYEDKSFHLVVLNLVFEWCGSRLDEDMEVAQHRLLLEMHRVLRDDGSLYLATKNRFALRLLLGGRDDHCYGLHFGSALPRRLLQLLLRARGHGRPWGVLHSYKTLRLMLINAGFADIESFWAVPEMRYPARYIGTDATAIRHARKTASFRQGETRLTDLLMPWIPAGLVKHVTPGLAFLAKRSNAHQ